MHVNIGTAPCWTDWQPSSADAVQTCTYLTGAKKKTNQFMFVSIGLEQSCQVLVIEKWQNLFKKRKNVLILL